MKTAALLRALLAAALLALPLAAGAAAPPAPSDGLSDGDRQCLGCHGAKGLEKTFADKSTAPLHVEGAAFAKSVHAPVGCAACHGDVDLAKHPGNAKTFADARAMEVSLSQVCRTCHDAIFDAYADGVHGKAIKAGGFAPVCSSCHGTHEIARASVSGALRDSCHGCHADAAASHAKWLPNSKVHLDVVACAACHAPAAGKRVELRFYEVSTKRELVADAGALVPVANVKGTGNGNGETQAVKPIDEARLREVVAAIQGRAPGKVVLAGRLEPGTGTDGHKLLGKDQALKDCAVCHRKGAEAFQNVSLSLVGSDGQRVRFDARSDVLQAPTSIDSVRGFYAMGGTRVQVLDILLALALVGGIAAPLGHMVMRKVLRKKGQDHE